MIYSLKENGYRNFKGSSNPKAKVTENDVKEIRYRIEVNQENRQEVFKDYQDRLSYSAFGKIVRYDT